MRARRAWFLGAIGTLIAACGTDPDADAYGNFEAEEVVVSSQGNGPLQRFTPVEGAELARGVVVGQVDTTQLALELAQLAAQREASAARVVEADRQIAVLEVQRDIARRAYERTRRLADQNAATAQQLDQAEREYRVVDAQIAAARAQRQSVAQQAGSSNARVARIRDLIARSRIVNPVAGTVLATFVRAGEVVHPGQPLYRIADLRSLTLRAYITAGQLGAVKLGQRVTVNVDRGDGIHSVPGTITWIASRAEFTPTQIQTRDARADLVYAIKLSVDNAAGELKVGMPADVSFTAPAATTAP